VLSLSKHLFEANFELLRIHQNCRDQFEIPLKVGTQDRLPFFTPLRSPVENAEKITGGAE